MEPKCDTGKRHQSEAERAPCAHRITASKASSPHMVGPPSSPNPWSSATVRAPGSLWRATRTMPVLRMNENWMRRRNRKPRCTVGLQGLTQAPLVLIPYTRIAGYGCIEMKTTVEISDGLAEEVKAYMAREGVTFRSVVERGLREVLRAGREAKPFKLRDASVGGRGVQAALRDASWERIRDAAYEGRGS